MTALALEIVCGLLILIGSVFAVGAAVGVIRMPDVYIRMHAATKAGTLGSGLILLAVALSSGELGVVTRALAAVVFLIITAPVAAHLLGRAAYISGVKTWEGTVLDELKGRYDPFTHELAATEPPEPPAAAPEHREEDR
jgi:multicomponent Na+:H+ antiporter subunit G